MNSEKNNIKSLLTKLGITENNKGCSNGIEWFGSGELINSHSPVNGSLLGKVQVGNKKDYNKLMMHQEMDIQIIPI